MIYDLDYYNGAIDVGIVATQLLDSPFATEPVDLNQDGYADLFPLYSNDTEMGRSKNRRVEFVLEKE